MNSNTNNKNGYQPKNNSTAKSRNRLPQKKNYRPRTNRRLKPLTKDDITYEDIFPIEEIDCKECRML